MNITIEHHTFAHCENGVVSTLLGHRGLCISEPLVFGLSSGLFFAHIPFVEMGGMPVTAFRTFPGVFFKRISKMLGVKVGTKRFLNHEKAMEALDENLENSIPTGCVVGMYYLSYMPDAYRFHFNGHNICVCGKNPENEEYIVSDPIATVMTTLSARDLERCRFAKGGTYPIMGQMYWIKEMPKEIPDLQPLVRKAILRNCNNMIGFPRYIPYFGVNGIFYLSRRIRKFEIKYGRDAARLNLANIVRMSEEIGTGGAGFRFLYGAFLQEAAKITGVAELMDFSARITEIGDMWREFSMMASRVFKKSQKREYSYDDLGDILYEIATREQKFFIDLRNLISSHG